jgi:hypothetical protein
MAREPSTSQEPQVMPAPGSPGQASLVAVLGLKTIAENSDELGLFYLIGCAYSFEGARSFRQIAELLREPKTGLLAEDLARRVGKDLPKSLRAIHKAVAVLENLLGKELVVRSGEGLGYCGLNEDGKRFWELTAAFVREFWA